MNGELEEIREFLDRCPDLAVLPPATRSALVRRLILRYLRAGSPFPPEDEDTGGLWILRTGAAELHDAHDQLRDRLGEGDLARFDAHASGEGHGQVTEDALIYYLPGTRARDLAASDAAFAEFLRADPLQETPLAPIPPEAGGDSALLTTPVRALMSPAPVIAPDDLSLRDAARRMTEADISALLLHAPDTPEHPSGILTDTDLRRALAQGSDTDAPVGNYMARELATVTRGMPAFEALLQMARRDIHHLPVLDSEKGRLVGMLSSTDLIRHQGTSAVYLVRDLRRAANLDALQEVMRALPNLQVHLVDNGADATQLTRTVSTVIDALTQRLIELAEAEFGPAPADFAWLASGSQGRHEQTVHTDQDTALIIADDAPPEADAWFERLARFVSDGLDACGIRACPGEVDPTRPDWRRRAADWRTETERVLHHPTTRDAMLVTHYLDLRVIHGNAGLFEPLHHAMLEAGSRQESLLTALADQARELRPPLGFFRRFVLERGGEHADTLDLKLRGLLPIVALARVFGLRAESTARATPERLRAARHAGVLPENTANNLLDAWTFLAGLRARHQAGQIRHGEAPDNALDPTSLSGLERSHLKSAFRMIAEAQKTALATAEQVHG